MFHRVLKPLFSNSFFLFGARGTGKTTFIRHLMHVCDSKGLFLDLLDPELEDRYSRRPKLLEAEIKALEKKPDFIIIDEVQKIPKLLNLVQKLMFDLELKFILTGSSSRKLKRQGGNLLAGRAFVYHLFPLSMGELGERFSLEEALEWGTLPNLYSMHSEREKFSFLRAYVLTYISQEIQMEQLLRDLDPFREFLPICSQMNGKILNFKRIAGEIGVDYKTVQKYYAILEETWLGFFLPAFSNSIRKAQKSHPKFYLFDTGVKRALDETLDVRLKESTSAYGEAFEHWVMLELYKRNQYSEKHFRMSYLCTKDDLEIDLILTKPGLRPIVIEIKSSQSVDEIKVRKLEKLAKDLMNPEIYFLSRDPAPQLIGSVKCLPWEQGLDKILPAK